MTIPKIVAFALGAAAAAKYPLIGIGAFAEGPAVMIATGFLVRHSLLKIIPTFAALCIGDLFADMAWYGVGKFYAGPVMHRRGKFFGITPERFETIKRLFLRNQNKILFISKLTLGFGLAKGVLMAAGASHVSLKRFMIINAAGEVLLVAALMAVGYLFGDTYAHISGALRPWFVSIGIAILIGAIVLFTHQARKKIA